MSTVGFFDKLVFRKSASVGLSLSSDAPNLPCDRGNLIVRAAEVLAGSRGKEFRETEARYGVAIALQKRIPIGAGLGGGSSDGACALFGLNRWWELGLSLQQLTALAAKLGSDVPFFLHGPSSICRGRGELVEPIAPPTPRWAVLLMPSTPIATAAVYAQFDAMNLGTDEAISNEPDWQGWTKLAAKELLPLLVNDLEAAAFSVAPEIGRLRAEAEKTISRVVRMSGSGSSLFSLFDEEQEARAAAEHLHNRLAVGCEAVEISPKLQLNGVGDGV